VALCGHIGNYASVAPPDIYGFVIRKVAVIGLQKHVLTSQWYRELIMSEHYGARRTLRMGAWIVTGLLLALTGYAGRLRERFRASASCSDGAGAGDKGARV
jgi:hypothetical protein